MWSRTHSGFFRTNNNYTHFYSCCPPARCQRLLTLGHVFLSEPNLNPTQVEFFWHHPGSWPWGRPTSPNVFWTRFYISVQTRPEPWGTSRSHHVWFRSVCADWFFLCVISQIFKYFCVFLKGKVLVQYKLSLSVHLSCCVCLGWTFYLSFLFFWDVLSVTVLFSCLLPVLLLPDVRGLLPLPCFSCLSWSPSPDAHSSMMNQCLYTDQFHSVIYLIIYICWTFVWLVSLPVFICFDQPHVSGLCLPVVGHVPCFWTVSGLSVVDHVL